MDYNGGNFAVLHNFGGANDGNGAYAPLIRGPDGGLYGDTDFGGSPVGSGTVFSLNPDGSNYVLLLVVTKAIGNQIVSLTSGSDGALYGACFGGGAQNRGTLFKLTTSGVTDNNLLNPPLSLGGGWRISGRGVANRTYTALANTSPALPPNTWTNLGTATSDGNGNWHFDDLTQFPARFYRSSYP